MRRCARCKIEKPGDHFTVSTRPSGGEKWDCYCRPCRAEYGREHYLANKEKYIRQANERFGVRVRERMVRLLAYLEDHPCVDCGETDPVVLQFDHVGEKRFDISSGVRWRTWDAVSHEIERCDVRCANCHRRRTAIAGGFARVLFSDPSGQSKLFP